MKTTEKNICRIFVSAVVVILFVMVGFFFSRDACVYVTLRGYTAQELEGVTVQVGGYTRDGTELYVFPMDVLEPLDEGTFIWRDAWMEASFDGQVDVVVKRYDEKLHTAEINLRPFLGRFLDNHFTFTKAK